MSRALRAAQARASMLAARSASQRGELAQALAPWQAPLAMLDGLIGVVRHVRRRPLFAVGAVLAAAFIRPRRALRWLRRGGATWLAARLLRPH